MPCICNLNFQIRLRLSTARYIRVYPYSNTCSICMHMSKLLCWACHHVLNKSISTILNRSFQILPAAGTSTSTSASVEKASFVLGLYSVSVIILFCFFALPESKDRTAKSPPRPHSRKAQFLIYCLIHPVLQSLFARARKRVI